MNTPEGRSGGADFTADRVNVGGDIAGRDKIVSHISTTNYYGAINSRARRAELPHQPYFFGREEELIRIADALDPEVTGWGALIDGPGGIGKTALAIRAGHLAPDEHFSTKIFLSAKVRELTPRGEQKLEDFMLPDYMALLTELARELGEDEIARVNPDERTNEVRRALANRRALIIFDNLETLNETERVRLFQFLKRLPRSCKAIVTSRRRTDVPADVIRLDRLSPGAAQQLIAKLAERYPNLARTEEDERQHLYETSRGNPLLIEWIAGQLGRQGSRCRTIVDACTLVEEAPKGNNPLEYIFGDLLDTCSENEIAVLAALSHFSQPIKDEQIATIAGVTSHVAQTALEDLTDRALLVGDVDTGTYLLPPLVSTFLRSRESDIIAQTAERLAECVFNLALENGYQKRERFATLEATWPLIAASLPYFLQGSFTRLRSLYSALKTFLDVSGRLDEWLACARRVEAWNISASGMRKKALSLRIQGAKYQLQEDFKSAIDAYRESVKVWVELEPESSDVASTLSDLAGAERLAGDGMSAEQNYREALRIARGINDYEGQAIYAGNLAELLIEHQDWSSAEKLAQEALQVSEAEGRQEWIAASCEFLAKALTRLGCKSDAIPYAKRAVEIHTRLRSPYLEEAQAVLKECEE